MSAIDVHAHFVPPGLVERVTVGGCQLGVTVENTPRGTRFRFGRDSFSRPLLSQMVDLAQRQTWLAERDIHLQVLSHWMDLAGYELGPEQSCLWARLVNDSLAEAVAGNPAFSAMAHLPLCAGALAADELERAVTVLGMKGAQIGVSQSTRPLDDPDLEPLWSVASELRVPLLIHPLGAAAAESNKLYLLTRYPLETTEAALRLSACGIPDRFPDLKVILIHGGGFLPYQTGRFDRGWSFPTERLPTDYRRWFYYDSILGPDMLANLGEVVGWDRILLGSDAPFPLGDPAPVSTIFKSAPAAALQTVLEGTSSKVFGLAATGSRECMIDPGGVDQR